MIFSTKKYVIFYSIPDFYDNSKYFYNYLCENELLCDYKFIWLIADKKEIERCKDQDKHNALFLYIYDIRSIYYYINARYVFHNLGFYLNPDHGRKMIVNFEHGMPFKTDGKTNKSFRKNQLAAFGFTYVLATSEFLGQFWLTSYQITKDQLIISPQPRTDLLYSQRKILDKLFPEWIKFRKKIIWMPTYRSTELSSVSEGKINEFGLNIFDEKDLIEINEKLKEENILLVMKPHFLQKDMPAFKMKLSNIENFTTQDIIEKNIDLYEILKDFDALITDYSSVLYEFLLLDRPIAFSINRDDIEEFNQSRGLCFERIDDILCGDILSSTEKFKDFVTDLSHGIDSFKVERNRVNNLVNTLKGPIGCETICLKLGLNRANICERPSKN